MRIGLGLGICDLAVRRGGAAPTPPDGFVLIIDTDGAYIIDTDGAYLMEAA